MPSDPILPNPKLSTKEFIQRFVSKFKKVKKSSNKGSISSLLVYGNGKIMDRLVDVTEEVIQDVSKIDMGGDLRDDLYIYVKKEFGIQVNGTRNFHFKSDQIYIPKFRLNVTNRLKGCYIKEATSYLEEYQYTQLFSLMCTIKENPCNKALLLFAKEVVEKAPQTIWSKVEEKGPFKGFMPLMYLMLALYKLQMIRADDYIENLDVDTNLIDLVSTAAIHAPKAWGKIPEENFKGLTPLNILMTMAIEYDFPEYLSRMLRVAYDHASSEAWINLFERRVLLERSIIFLEGIDNNKASIGNKQHQVSFVEKAIRYASFDTVAEKKGFNSVLMWRIAALEKAPNDPDLLRLALAAANRGSAEPAESEWGKKMYRRPYNGDTPLSVLVRISIKNGLINRGYVTLLSNALVRASKDAWKNLSEPKNIFPLMDAIRKNPEEANALVQFFENILPYLQQEFWEEQDTQGRLNVGVLVQCLIRNRSISENIAFNVIEKVSDETWFKLFKEESFLNELLDKGLRKKPDSLTLLYIAEKTLTMPTIWIEADDQDITPLTTLMQLFLGNPENAAIKKLAFSIANKVTDAEAWYKSCKNIMTEDRDVNKGTLLSILIQIFMAGPSERILIPLISEMADQVSDEVWVKIFAANKTNERYLLLSLMKVVKESPDDKTLINFAINLTIHAPEEAWAAEDENGNTALSILTELAIQVPRYKFIDTLVAVTNTLPLNAERNKLVKNKSLLGSLLNVVKEHSYNVILINFVQKVAYSAPAEIWEQIDEDGNTTLYNLVQLVVQETPNEFINTLVEIACNRASGKAWYQLLEDKSLLIKLMHVLKKNPDSPMLIKFIIKIAGYASDEDWAQEDAENNTPLSILAQLVIKKQRHEFLDLLVATVSQKTLFKAWSKLLKDGSLLGPLIEVVSLNPRNLGLINFVQKAVVHAPEEAWLEEEEEEAPLVNLISMLCIYPGNSDLVGLLEAAVRRAPQRAFEKIEKGGPFKGNTALRLLFTAFEFFCSVKDMTDIEDIIKVIILATGHASPDALIQDYQENKDKSKTDYSNPLQTIAKIFADYPLNKNIGYLAGLLPFKVTKKEAWRNLFQSEEDLDVLVDVLKNKSDKLHLHTIYFIKKVIEHASKDFLIESGAQVEKAIEEYGISSHANDKPLDQTDGALDVKEHLVQNNVPISFDCLSQLLNNSTFNKVIQVLNGEDDNVLLGFAEKVAREKRDEIPARKFIAVMAKRGESFADELEKKKLQKALLKIYCPNRENDNRKYFHSFLFRPFGAYSKSEKMAAGEAMQESDGEIIEPAAKQGLLGKIAGLTSSRVC